MARYPLNRDKRKSQRYPVLEPRDVGELRIGEKRFPVQLLDESAGGFAVAAENPSGIIQGEVGLLRAGKDWYQVRVVKVMPMRPLDPQQASDSEPALPEYIDPSLIPRKRKARSIFRKRPPYRIGLSRLCDVDNPDVKITEIFWRLLVLRLWQLFPGKGLVKFFCLFFIVLAAGTTVASLLIWGSRKAAVPTAWENVQEPPFQPLRDAEIPVSQSDENISSTPTYADSPPREPQAISSLRRQKFQEVIRHARGAVAFLEPEVAEELQLTEPQRQVIRAIAEDAQKKIEVLQQMLAPADSPDQYAQYEERVFSQAREKAIQTLTDRQRKRWNALAGKDSQEGK